MCTSPKYAKFNEIALTINGKHPLSFLSRHEYEIAKSNGVQVFEIPCKKCLDCSLKYAREWALRCMLEAKQYKDNYFVTLTYDDSHIPDPIPICNHSTGEVIECISPLVPEHFSSFVKKLRVHYKRKYGHTGIRFFGCGEYGSESMRCHFHFIFFNLPIYDLKFWKRKRGINYYLSETLSKIWKNGYITVCEVTTKSAAYVARYQMKKQVKNQIEDLPPEFIRMSRRPGIGLKYFEDFYYNIYKTDEIYHEGQKYRPPKYYDRKLGERYEKELEQIKETRRLYQSEVLDRHSPSFESRKILEKSKLYVEKILKNENLGLDKCEIPLYKELVAFIDDEFKIEDEL